MIWISTQNTNGGPVTETSLAIPPMDVDYPDARSMKVQTSQDGNIVVQRPLMDSRPRKWLWRGYGPNDSTYAAQWAFLQSLDYSTRVALGQIATVGVWEDVTGLDGLARLTGGSRLYTTVKMTQVTRAPRNGGGPVIYEASVEFYIQDPSWTNF